VNTFDSSGHFILVISLRLFSSHYISSHIHHLYGILNKTSMYFVPSCPISLYDNNVKSCFYITVTERLLSWGFSLALNFHYQFSIKYYVIYEACISIQAHDLYSNTIFSASMVEEPIEIYGKSTPSYSINTIHIFTFLSIVL
jgi:hypothetical protein